MKRAELDAIAATCRDASLALIGDEVFNAYPLDPGAPTVSSVLDQNEVLTFSLGGLSKAAGLPQVKLGWTLVHGPEELVEPALARLALICDTYLSVSTPVQHAVPALLEVGQNVSVQIAERIRENYGELQRLAVDHSASRILRAEGGWYAVIQVPATRPEETLVLELLERDRVLVHPGYFFDFPREAFLVLSLLPEPDRFREGVRRMLTRVENLRNSRLSTVDLELLTIDRMPLPTAHCPLFSTGIPRLSGARPAGVLATAFGAAAHRGWPRGRRTRRR